MKYHISYIIYLAAAAAAAAATIGEMHLMEIFWRKIDFEK